MKLTGNNFSRLINDSQYDCFAASTVNVQYAYDSGGSSSNEIRLNQVTYPDSGTLTLAVGYGTSGGMNDRLNRVDDLQNSAISTTLAEYTYLGDGTVVRIEYPEPSVWLDLWGGTSGTFNGLDQFNRIVDQGNETGTQLVV